MVRLGVLTTCNDLNHFQAVWEGVQAAGFALAHAIMQGLQGADEEQQRYPWHGQEPHEERQDRQFLSGEAVHRAPPHSVVM